MLLRDMQAYPDDDGVVSLKRREKFVSSHDLGLIQRTKTTQHLDVALCDRLGHPETPRWICKKQTGDFVMQRKEMR